MKTQTIIIRALSIIAAIILLQTLFFKFTAHPDSVMLFTTLGVEPWGRIGLGIVELITAILLIYPRTTAIGSVLGLGIISGAIFSHLFIIGIVFNNDGGALFMLALAVFISCLIVAFMKKDELLAYIKK